MTREEAIRIIETVFQDEYVYKYYDSITHQALNMAIEALSQPIVCKDFRIDDDHIYCSPMVADRVVEALTRLNGEWTAEEEYGDLWVCDQCGFASEHNDNFCPNCGADMRGET